MKHYTQILEKNLSYKEAYDLIKSNKFKFITRPCWSGIHFINNSNEYCILLRDGSIMINPEKILDTDKKDWIIVNISHKTYDILSLNKLI